MEQTIGQLNAEQLAHHASNVFLLHGRNQTGAKLIYRALELDPCNAVAIRCLSDFFDTKGMEIFSAVVLEHALTNCTKINKEDRKELDHLRFFAKWTWAFSRHKSGETDLGYEAFADQSEFVVDEKRYKEFLDQIIDRTGSLENAFKSAHTLCGVSAELLTPEKPDIRITDCIRPEQCERAKEYDDWLQSTTKELDALEVERQKKTTSKKKPRRLWR